MKKKVTNKFLKTIDPYLYIRLLYNRLYEYFIENELITSNQSGFKPGYSCVNQLLSITHDIYQSFDNAFKIPAFLLQNRMEQTGPKYSQFRELEYLQENTFELLTSFWKHCFQLS